MLMDLLRVVQCFLVVVSGLGSLALPTGHLKLAQKTMFHRGNSVTGNVIVMLFSVSLIHHNIMAYGVGESHVPQDQMSPPDMWS